MKKFHKYCSIVLVLLFACDAKTQTYYVTNTSIGLTGSFDVVIAQAVTAANAGGNVIVNMNAPGLCSIGILSNPVVLTNGTITIQKDPAILVTQGFVNTNGSGISGCPIICVLNNTTSCLTVKNLTFDHFYTGLLIAGGNTVTVEGSIFTHCNQGILFNNIADPPNYTPPTLNILVQNCVFDDLTSSTTNGYGGILRDNFINSTLPKTLKILNNDFKNANWLSANIRTSASQDNIKVEFKNNYSSINHIFAFFGAGYIYSPNYLNNNDSNDYLFDLDFQNNTNLDEIHFCTPMNYWRVDNNSFNGYSSIYINNPSAARNYKMGLINTSSAYCNNQNYNNGNNNFLYPSTYPSISSSYVKMWIYGSKGPGCALTEVLDLDIPGSVVFWGNVSIRRNKIFASLAQNTPLLRSGGGPSAVLFPIIVNTGQLTAYYTYSGVSNIDNNDLYVDFYKSNANGDLLDYIGYQYIPAGTLTGYNNVTLPIPAGVSLSQSDRVAMTITGLQPIGSTNVVALGTSIAFYPIAPCTSPNFAVPAPGCIGPVSFVANSSCVHPQTAMWNFGDGSFGNGGYATHTYNAPGTYNVTLMVNAPWQNTTYTSSNPVTINNCQPPQACANCIGSFAPDAGEYILSAWVKEDANLSPISYNNAKVQVSFTGHPNVYTFGTNIAKNKIIDGWQRIEESFTIPVNATHVNLNLVNTALSGGADIYFDDIRIFPKDGQMKTYVYDPITLKLSAVLDENNYASFYEYDEEGKLLRVKKETEKGIMTLQENRENLKKK